MFKLNTSSLFFFKIAAKAFFIGLLLLCFSVEAVQEDEASPLEVLKEKTKAERTFRYDEGEELIFTVVIDKFILGELIATVTDDGLAFDLENYLDVLDFPITKKGDLSYEGWFIKEENTFVLDINELLKGSSNNAFVLGQNKSISDDDYLVSDDILFIDEIVLTKFFGVKHKINYSALEVFLTSDELLPLQAKLQRERQYVRSSGFNKPKHPELYRGYELLSPQVFDFLTSSNYRESTDRFNYNYSLIGTRDIALVHADYYFDGNDNDLLNRARLKVSRKSSEGGLLGFLNATSVEVGDVRPVRQAFGQSGQESRGLRISNTNLRNNLDNEVLTLQGPVQAGWDAELYRNGVLIDRKFDISVGQYEFIDIPLLFGINEFEVILYGPQGQKVSEKYTKALDQNLLSGDGIKYDFSFNEINESLFGVGDLGEETGYAFSGGVTQTIFDSFGISAGILSQFGGQNERNEVNLGVNTILFDRAYLSANTSIDDQDNLSTNLSARTQLLNQALSLTLSTSSNNQSEVSDRNRAIFSMSGGVQLGRSFGLSYENFIDYQEDNTQESLRFVNRLGFNLNKVRLFHNLENTKITDANGFTSSQYLGGLSIDGNIGPINARLLTSYSLDDNEYEPVNYQGNFTWQVTNNIKSRFNITHEVANKVNRYSIQTAWLNDKLNISSNVGYSDDLGWDMGLSARFSLLGQASEYNSIYSTGTSSTQRGALSVRVFEDLNVNAVYDDGEPLLENVLVTAAQSFARGKTNENGIAVLDGIPDQRANDILIDTDTLPDPFMVPLVPGVSIKFRAGLVDKLDYPVAKSAEIEGVVNIVDGDTETQGKNMPILLKNANGRVIKTTETEYDGYFVFDKIIPGSYSIEIPESVFEDRDLEPSKPIRIKTDRNSTLINGGEIILQQRQYESSFATTHGNYSSLKMLEVAKRLLQSKLMKSAPKFFYLKPNNSERYTLVSGFSKDENMLTQTCNLFKQNNLNCEIQAVEIPYSKK